jgi:enoyl-CoA hydratase/carnithine racemase
MDDTSVLYESDGRIATLTLNRPENRNSMTPDVMARFRACVARARAERELRCLVITGRGSSFCAGADFRAPSGPAAVPASAARGREGAPAAGEPARDAASPVLPHERSFASYEAFLDVTEVEVPTIAAMNGHAVGGGLGLALVCDLRVANREARYGANFARLGFHSGMAVSYLLPRLVGVPHAVDLLLTGRLLSGSEAAAMGLVHEAVAADEVAAAARRRAEAIAEAAPLAVRGMKRSLYRGLGWDPREAARREAFAQAETLATEDAREGIRALLEKRAPVFRGR